MDQARAQPAATAFRLEGPGLGRFGQASLLLYATLVLILGWSHTLWRIQDDRKVTLAASHKQLATLSKALASQLEAMVADGVGAASAAANILREQPGKVDPQQLLDSMLTGGRYVRALFLLEGDRVVIANAGNESLTREHMPWLREMRGSAEDVWVG